MTKPGALFVMLAFMIGLAGCVHRNRQDAVLAPLRIAAGEFRCKAGQDRRKQGEAIAALLPTRSITWREDTGIGELETAGPPSYRLSKKELYRELGQPDGSYDGQVWYDLDHDSKKIDWQLTVELYRDHVLSATIYGVFEGKEEPIDVHFRQYQTPNDKDPNAKRTNSLGSGMAPDEKTNESKRPGVFHLRCYPIIRNQRVLVLSSLDIGKLDLARYTRCARPAGPESVK